MYIFTELSALIALLSVCSFTIGDVRLEDEIESPVESSTSLSHPTKRQPNLAIEHERLARARIKAAREAADQELLDSFYNFHYNYEQMDQQMNLSEFAHIGAKIKTLSLVHSDAYIHSYDNFHDLLESGGPTANQELCLSQLTELAGRAQQLERLGYNSNDVNLVQLLDTFGKPPAGWLSVGDFFLVGMYNQCVHFNIRLQQSHFADDLQAEPGERRSRLKVTPTRYCLASLRHIDWPSDSARETSAVLKSGVCLPATCDSLNYKNKFELINRLLETQTRKIDRGNFYVSDLYCLPDEQSSLRQFWRSPASLVTFLTLSGWIGLQIFATLWIRKQRNAVGDESISSASVAQQRRDPASVFNVGGISTQSVCGHQSADYAETEQSATKRRACQSRLELFNSLSVTDNFAELFDLTKTSPTGRDGRASESSGVSPGPKYGQSGTRGGDGEPLVDLRSLEGIKVISMSYVILGHVILSFTMIANNCREQADDISLAFFLSNSLPAFAVNTFFTITGLLTAYLLFKRNKSVDFMSSPTNWMAVIAYRYLRIMPMYALVVIYLKTLAKYTGSGPYWDYGTTAMGPRKKCEQESLLWTLLFGANFKPPLDHCIPSCWHLANDFQFFIVTPILLTILNKSPTLGKRVLKWGMFAGHLAGVWSILAAPTDDLRPVAKFMPHGFKTYTTHLSHNYTQPQYRIPAYLFGLLIGFLLHEFEQKQLVYLSFKAKRESLDDKEESEKAQVQPADWPESIKRYGFAICVACVLLCFAVPSIGHSLPMHELLDRFVMAVIMPTMHLLVSFAVGIYILLASTGFGNSLVNMILSHPLWKPLAKLSLCAVLCNIEVIAYIVQSSTHSSYIDSAGLFGLDLLCIVTVYAVSALVYVLFEAPMRGALNHLLSHLMSVATTKPKME